MIFDHYRVYRHKTGSLIVLADGGEIPSGIAIRHLALVWQGHATSLEYAAEMAVS